MNYPGSNMTIRKRQPTHPCGILKRHYFEPLSLTIAEVADDIGVSRKTFSKIINDRGSIIPDMALRLFKAFNTSAELWLNLQANYDLRIESQKSKDCLSSVYDEPINRLTLPCF